MQCKTSTGLSASACNTNSESPGYKTGILTTTHQQLVSIFQSLGDGPD